MAKFEAFGKWKSPIQPENFQAPGSVVLSQIACTPNCDSIFRLEVRADEDGRGVIVQCNLDGSNSRDLLSKSTNVASQVHECKSTSQNLTTGLLRQHHA